MSKRPTNLAFRGLCSLVLFIAFAATTCLAASPNVVISQIYGGGGNSGATIKNDFIELYNRGSVPVNLAGWSVQYASATGTAWQVTALSGSIQPGGYYLVQEAQGAGGTAALPTPDATGTIAMSATAGKVALISNSTALTGACPLSSPIVDLVGYGSTANCFEFQFAPAPSNTLADIRAGGGATDTDNNSADFSTGAPNPHNSVPLNSLLGGIGSATPASADVNDSVLLSVTTGFRSLLISRQLVALQPRALQVTASPSPTPPRSHPALRLGTSCYQARSPILSYVAHRHRSR
jgi:predicted extracellular nuclease